MLVKMDGVFKVLDTFCPNKANLISSVGKQENV